MEPFTAVYANREVIVPMQSEADSLYHDGYGYRKNKTHHLRGVEALYNVERGKLVVVDEDTNKSLSFQEILHRLSIEEPGLWTSFIVYKDLRTRGFVVEIVKQDFRIYERGDYGKKSASYHLKIISEGKPEQVETILDEMESIRKDTLSMKVAVVDRRGEIVYYGLEEKDL